MAGQVGAVDPGRVAHFRAPGWWRDGTILDDVDRAVARHPDRVAVVAHRAGRVEVLSYRHLDRLADRFAGALLELGVRPGDPVSFQLPNWWEFVALFLGCARIGAVTNAIVPILRRREVGFILERVGSRVCIAPASFRGFDHAAMLAEIRESCPTLEHVFVIGGEGPPGTRSFEEFFVDRRRESRALRAELDALRPHGDALAQIQFTSGTTGEPKGVLHSFNTLDVGVRAVGDPLGLTGDDVVLMFSPMGHQTGFLYGMCMPLRLGMKTVLQDVWDPQVMLRLVEDEGVTWTMGSTTFVLDACAAAADAHADLSTLRFFTCGGAPIPPTAVTQARERLGVPLVAVW
ncbi:MAG TPA: AMP-binding protein, partial [Candidatus Dormibacteraeota bacterium]